MRLNSVDVSLNQKLNKNISGKAIDIVRGFNYLNRRFGHFVIKEEMIGCTELGIVKVWFNEDFSLNTKSEVCESEEMMVVQLIKILQ